MTELSERRITNGDFKRIYLPIGDWDLIPPSEGIYDEPAIYYKANIKWAALIEGFVSWLTEITAWKNAEDENYSGIQSIMTFLERIVIEIDCAQIEDCLETSTIINQMITNITNNTTNITAAQDEIETINQSAGSENIVPPANEATGNDICKSADYISQQILERVTGIFDSKNSTDYGDWLIDTLDNGGGWIAGGLETIWGAVNGDYANTIADLVTYNPQIVNAIANGNVDRIDSKLEILADTSISTYIKDIVAGLLDATSDGMWNQWGFLGKETSDATCATESWNWLYSTLGCDYALPTGWTLTVLAGACGDGLGAFNGLYDVDYGGIATVQVLIEFPATFIANIVTEGFANDAGAADIRFQAGSVDDTQVFALYPTLSTNSVLVNETVSSITITARHYSYPFSPYGLVVNRIGVNQ